MVTAIEEVIRKAAETGLLAGIALILFFTLYYKLLERSKVFGESKVAWFVIAFSAALLTSIAFVVHIAVFFLLVWMMVLAASIGLMVASFFHPKLKDLLIERLRSPAVLAVIIVLTIIAMGVSLLLVGIPPVWFPGLPPYVLPPLNVLLTAITLIALVLVLLIAVAIHYAKK